MQDKLDSTESPGHSRVIARQLAWGFGLVSIVAIAMCTIFLFQLSRVGGLVGAMQHQEHSIQRGAQLVGAIREQYIHLAHSVIEGDDSHLDHYLDWGKRVHADVAALRPYVPESQRWHLDEITQRSTAIDAALIERIVPKLEAGALADVRTEHRAVVELAQEAFEHADIVAKAVEGQMAGHHTVATDVTNIALLSGLVCVGLVLLLSVGYTVKLRRSVLSPLRRLSEAARRVGDGELFTRVGQVGVGELQEVANAFDQMAAELGAREARLVKAERMAAIGQLAAGVAHEMNNPIGIIRGYLKTMSPDEEPEVLADELRILDEEAAACQRIADDLLTYARRPVLRLAPIRMDELLHETVARLSDGGDADGRRFQVVADEAEISGDRDRLRQVVANLLLNAVQVSPQSSIVEVRGRTTDDGGYEIHVLDRGPGISEEDLGRVFEPFFTKRPGGSGLGLAVCQGLIASHGGSIGASGRTGGGASFRVRLPARPPESPTQDLSGVFV